jgi:steroid delta-isomerase-like uncharacterized protein
VDHAEIVQAYFDAWNAHDADAIVATFAKGGTYQDPTTAGPLQGDAIGANAAVLWTAFPDVSFELLSHAAGEGGLSSAQWRMVGTNTGSFMGLPPSGRSVVLDGADFIRVGPGGIQSVEGYFSPGAVPQQIGMQVIVQPSEAGPFTFGNAVRVGGDIEGAPGAFSITSLKPRNAEEVEQVRELSRQVASQMKQLKGFMGWVGATVGDRMVTITAWSSPEDSKQVMRLDPHRQGTKGFFGTELADGGWVSVWTPEHIRPVWARCDACGTMANTSTEGGTCSCGATLPPARVYW